MRAIVRAPPPASSAAARAVMQGNRGRDSSPEARLRSALHRRGLRFRKHLHAVDGIRCRPDVVFGRARVVVFVDGCFWHGCPDHGTQPQTNAAYWRAKIALNQARDARQTRALEDAGWTVVRVWEHEPTATAADAVEDALRRGKLER